jgi:hypothetical protein
MACLEELLPSARFSHHRYRSSGLRWVDDFLGLVLTSALSTFSS